MNKPVIVSGEASETDSEEDDPVFDTAQAEIIQIKGHVVSGEDSESENENDGSVSSASVVSAISSSRTDEVKQTTKCDSLLHQKLRESNTTFYNNLDDYVKTVVGNTEKSLIEVDQQILKSQLVVQGAANSLKTFNAQANVLKHKLHTLLSSNFLSNVKISD